MRGEVINTRRIYCTQQESSLDSGLSLFACICWFYFILIRQDVH